ncbi:Hypothetical protein NTJ_01936 [Nesidiocoris tenuis]|uniref:Uncharacterized protein n=1 Tax=Nesidiocoris tenuis TaxID=355587 RepID=A0ABN7AD88_9HEMI|nr:Hypothetical protein NTJ_01936 [Nesidiocoris tenuis]
MNFDLVGIAERLIEDRVQQKEGTGCEEEASRDGHRVKKALPRDKRRGKETHPRPQQLIGLIHLLRKVSVRFPAKLEIIWRLDRFT